MLVRSSGARINACIGPHINIFPPYFEARIINLTSNHAYAPKWIWSPYSMIVIFSLFLFIWTHWLCHCLYFLHVISLDFSKAFDTVRHSSLVHKLLQFPIPSSVHNWFVHYLSCRSHCTEFQSTISGLLTINASIFQGTGPVSPAYFRVSDLYRIYSIHPIWFLVAPAIVSINTQTTLISWYLQKITILSPLNWKTFLNGLLPITWN